MASFKRLPLRESVIRKTTIQALQMGAVNLSQGFPDDDAPTELKELARQAVAGCNHQYTDPAGAPVLRRAIAHKMERFNGIAAHPDRNVVVTCGATEGMVVAMEALIERNHEVITFAPMYENYVLQSIVSGLRLRILETHEPEFSFTREQLEDLYTPQTAAILLCNPCNPTGKVFTRDELQIISQFAVDHDLLIFADETYEYLVWPGHKHVSIGSLPIAQDRTVTVTSMGKTYSVTGWRVGYVVAQDDMTEQIRNMHDFHTVTAPHPFQIALAGALGLPDKFYDNLRREYWERKEMLCDAIEKCGMTFYDPGGSYFLWCEYAGLSDEDDAVFGERLMREAGVAGVPGSVFYPARINNPRRIRFTFSKCRATIEEAARRLAKFR